MFNLFVFVIIFRILREATYKNIYIYKQIDYNNDRLLG